MAGEPMLTVVGNAARDAELRYTTSGTAICAFDLIVTARVKKDGAWVDGKTTGFQVKVWGEPAAVNADATIRKGMRLIVQGRMEIDRWTSDRDGKDYTKAVIWAEEIGPSIRWA